jgi:hypothetical protein
MANLSNVEAIISGTTITVTGHANGGDKVRVLVNPVLGPAHSSAEAIYNGYASISCLAKKHQDVSSGNFSIDLDVGNADPLDIQVVVVTESGKGENPPIQLGVLSADASMANAPRTSEGVGL